MIPDQYIAVAALVAGVLSKPTRRHAALCFGFAAVFFIWHYFFASPADFRTVGYSWWFVSCALGEAAIMVTAWAVSSPASPYVAILATLNLLMNLWAGAVYRFVPLQGMWGMTAGVYHHIIPMITLMQLCTLFLYSWPSLWIIRKTIRAYIRHRKGSGKCYTMIHI